VGIAFIKKCVYGNLSIIVKESYISYSFQYRRHFKSFTLVTSTSILKVGVVPVYQALKIKVGYGSWTVVIEEQYMFRKALYFFKRVSS